MPAWSAKNREPETMRDHALTQIFARGRDVDHAGIEVVNGIGCQKMPSLLGPKRRSEPAELRHRSSPGVQAYPQRTTHRSGQRVQEDSQIVPG